MTPSGTLTTLYSFCPQGAFPLCADGENPNVGLVQATGGGLYGTTDVGGASDNGTVFRLTPGGGLTTLYSFPGDLPGRPASAGESGRGNQWRILRDYGTGRGERLRHGIPNHPERYTNDPLQLLLPGELGRRQWAPRMSPSDQRQNCTGLRHLPGPAMAQCSACR